MVTWSFYWLYKGKWPDVDCFGVPWTDDSPMEKTLAGTELADGLCAFIYSLKGDLDYFARTLKLRHYNANHMCDMCPASRLLDDRTLLYNNFDRDARWMHMTYSSRQWTALYEGCFKHWVFNLPGVSNLMIDPDELHVLYLGVHQYVIGSVLHLLCYKVLPGGAENNMEIVWNSICQFYRLHRSPCQYTYLSCSSFGNPEKAGEDFPRLRGKGAEAKDLLPAVHQAWLDLASSSSIFQEVKDMLDPLLEAQIVLQSHSKELILPLPAADQLERNMDAFLLQYQRLASKAERESEYLWNNPTKFHWAWHLAHKARWVHPRRTSTMIDEDCVGRFEGVG